MKNFFLLSLLFFYFPQIEAENFEKSEGEKLRRDSMQKIEQPQRNLILPLFSEKASPIQTIDSYASIFAEIEKAEEGTLLVFDVDETLITFKDTILRECGQEARERLVAPYMLSMSKEEYRGYRSIIMQECEWQIVDELLPALFEKIYQKNLRVIGLTAMKPGAFGKVASMQHWRKKQLADLNFEFYSPATFDEKKFTQFETDTPCYFEGILCSSSHPKGAVLEAFLQELPHPPKKVLFFDDLEDRVVSVVESMQKRGVPVVGYRYVGSAKLNKPPNLEIAKKQISHLFHHKTWLSEKQVAELEQNAELGPKLGE